jgi:hypothetical protein
MVLSILPISTLAKFGFDASDSVESGTTPNLHGGPPATAVMHTCVTKREGGSEILPVDSKRACPRVA